MDVQLINKDLLSELHEKAARNERLRMKASTILEAKDGAYISK